MNNHDLVTRFTRFADEAGRKHGIICQLAEVRGARWSFVSGRVDGIPAEQPKRIPLNDCTGVIIYGWNGLSEAAKAEIQGLARKLVSKEKVKRIKEKGR